MVDLYTRHRYEDGTPEHHSCLARLRFFAAYFAERRKVITGLSFGRQRGDGWSSTLKLGLFVYNSVNTEEREEAGRIQQSDPDREFSELTKELAILRYLRTYRDYFLYFVYVDLCRGVYQPQSEHHRGIKEVQSHAARGILWLEDHAKKAGLVVETPSNHRILVANRARVAEIDLGSLDVDIKLFERPNPSRTFEVAEPSVTL